MNFAKPDGWEHDASWTAACTDLDRLASLWGVVLEGQVPGATCSLIARGQRGADAVVIKIALASEERISGVPAAIAHAGHGGIPVWDFDAEAGATLMPLADGPTLDQVDMSDDQHALVQADVSRRLQTAPPAEVWSMERWFESLLGADADAVSVDAVHITRAVSLFHELERTTTRRTLVHGDLHHFNIIKHGGQWVAIDPKGMWCDPAVEPGAYLRNIYDRLPVGDEMVALTKRRLDLFSSELGEPWDRVWGWGYVVAVISVLWASEDFLPPWTELVHALARLEP